MNKLRICTLTRCGVVTLATLGLAAGLSGCSDSMKQSFGVGKTSPDEFQVVEQAPLELPPDFNLRPPAPGAPRPQDTDIRRQADAYLDWYAAVARPREEPPQDRESTRPTRRTRPSRQDAHPAHALR